MKQAILDATGGGLDVILAYYPDAEHCIGTNKHFRMRAGEKDASACIREEKGVWYVTDFGDDARKKNCFDVVMAEEGVTFKDAVAYLAKRYNIENAYKADVNKPNKEFRTVEPDAKEGIIGWEFTENPHSNAAVLGVMVTEEVMENYKIYSLKNYKKVFKKENGTKCEITVSSNENFPIFLFDYTWKDNDGVEHPWHKIYCPMAFDKKDRFFYNGEKPTNHVFFGLQQVEELAAKVKASAEEKEYYYDKEGKKQELKKKTKLDYVFICAGERDALNCIGMGYPAVWMNSETAELSDFSFNKLSKYAEKVINIPDIDDTGIRKAYERALQHWRLYTILLPNWVSESKDRRGYPCKDLTDFCYLLSKKESNFNARKMFDRLVSTAVQCQFWEKTEKKNKEVYEINTISLLWFLRCSGFARIKDKGSSNERYVRIQGYKVIEYKPKDIRSFVKEQLREQAVSVAIQRLYQDSKKTTSTLCDDLPLVEIDLAKSDPFSRVLFFENHAVKVSASDIEIIHTKNISKYCWDKAIAPHRFKRIAPAFTLSEDKGFQVQNIESKLFSSLINSSRMYWRQEFEERVTGDADTDALYRQEYKFSISGPRLSAEERYEQLQHLANKCYALGYLLHQYKFMSLAMAVWLIENRLTDDGKSEGGSGKSFFMNALRSLNLLNIVPLSGRQKGLTENKHLFDRVNCWTDVLFVDDPAQDFDFNTFYSTITGDTIVNRKGVDSETLSYKDSPITVFASNFPPRTGKEGSTDRRLLYMVYSDYYHAAGKSYDSSHKICDDFGKDLYDYDYTEDEYNADYNFCIDCLQFYLQLLARNEDPITPPMENIYKRINISEMGNSGFREWAEFYFSEQNEYIDILIPRADAFESFREETGNRSWSAQKFKKALIAFCENSDKIIAFNPPALCNDGKRITRKANGKMIECLYIQTQETLNDTLKGQVF